MRQTVLTIALLTAFFAPEAARGAAPPPPLQDVRVEASAVRDPVTGAFTYQYRLTNPATNFLAVSAFKVDITLPVDAARLPEGRLPRGPEFLDPGIRLEDYSLKDSLFRVYRREFVRVGLFTPAGWKVCEVTGTSETGLLPGALIASWRRPSFEPSVGALAPGQSLEGFRVTSFGLPTIRDAEVQPPFSELEEAGLIPADWWVYEDDPVQDFDGKARLRESLGFRTKTIGPTGPPAAFVPTSFNQTLRDYVSQSVALGWLKDATLTSQLNTYLSQVDASLRAEQYLSAQQTLTAFQQAIRNVASAQRTPEADALLSYNAQYLSDRIQHSIPNALSVAPLSAVRPINEEQGFVLRVVQGLRPRQDIWLGARILEGPHAGLSWDGRTDQQGEWRFAYRGERVGRDTIALGYLFSGENEGPVFQEIMRATVIWKGGPDLTLGRLFPPALKIPAPGPTISIQESTTNIGTVAAAPSTTRYYLSSDRQVEPGDAVLGERRVRPLQPQEVDETRQTFPVPALASGVYWLLACADAPNEIAELDETNNCRTLQVDVVALIDTPNRPPDCSQAKAVPSQLWPPNHKMQGIQIQGVTDPDGDPVTVRVTSVKQDEPVQGLGDGDTSPDAVLSPLQVRSERSGTGNGRVYHIYFTADDGKGGTCGGDVTVCVPRDQGKDAVCRDEGPLYDSGQR